MKSRNRLSQVCGFVLVFMSFFSFSASVADADFEIWPILFESCDEVLLNIFGDKECADNGAYCGILLHGFPVGTSSCTSNIVIGGGLGADSCECN